MATQPHKTSGHDAADLPEVLREMAEVGGLAHGCAQTAHLGGRTTSGIDAQPQQSEKESSGAESMRYHGAYGSGARKRQRR